MSKLNKIIKTKMQISIYNLFQILIKHNFYHLTILSSKFNNDRVKMDFYRYLS